VYTKLVNAIPWETEADFKASLVGKMQYLHEYSLRKRLKKITDDLKNVIGILIKDVSSFIKSIEDTRNFLTHYDKSLEDKKKDGQGLYALTEQMKFLLEMCFLSEIGMTEDKIKQLVTRNQRYQYLA
jgi:ApeA N-terminal domain 1